MVGFRRHEAWDHTASVIAAVYQTACAEEGRVLYPEQFHPGFVPVGDAAESGSPGDRVLPVGTVPQDMVFGMMRKAFTDECV